MATVPAAEIEAPTLPNFIAANLKVLRKERGWSQTELAERVHLNRGNIASYESGCAEPSLCKTLRISQQFGISARDLIRRDLSDAEELTLARLAHTEDERERRERITAFRTDAGALSDLVTSSRRLFDYRRKNVAQPCPEADQLAAHYEQLFQVTKQLLDNHRDLLGEVGCQCD